LFAVNGGNRVKDYLKHFELFSHFFLNVETNRKLAMYWNFKPKVQNFSTFSSGFEYENSRLKYFLLFSDHLEKKSYNIWPRNDKTNSGNGCCCLLQVITPVYKLLVRKSTIASPSLWITLSVIERLMFCTQGYSSEAKSTFSIRTERKKDMTLYFLVHFMFRVQIICMKGNGSRSPPFTAFHSNSFTQRFIYFPLKASLFR
jgi:hypothetical protein